MTQPKKQTAPALICTGIIVIFFMTYFSAFAKDGALSRQRFFTDTDHHLEVIRIKGKKPGLTVLIFGGIHGDEPGGYFSSEILCKVKLHKGNLIIVPRVNFPSIMLNRREVHGDMNRKFGKGEQPGDPDAEVIRLLKKLMKEADLFINQHDAFGFHREKYIDEMYNPSRYGQSLIIDSSRFFSKKLGKEISLGEIGKRIMNRVNKRIKNPDYHFGFWDHNSLDRKTKHLEMRKSATYYALTTHSIPAFGLETSKDLPTLYHKVKYQLLMIEEILREFGLEAEFPSSKVIPPVLYWVEFLKNGKEIIRINGNTNLRLNPGDKIRVKHIFSNYDTGLSANIHNWGTINDIDKEYEFKGNATIVIKKNHITMGKIYLRHYLSNSIKEVVVEINGKETRIPTWGKIEVKTGQYFNIKGTIPDFSNLRFDVRGFSAPPGKKGDGGVNIYPRQLLDRYSFKENDRVYFVKIYNDGRFAGGFQLEILP